MKNFERFENSPIHEFYSDGKIYRCVGLLRKWDGLHRVFETLYEDNRLTYEVETIVGKWGDPNQRCWYDEIECPY